MAEITLDTLRKQRGQAADVPAEETPDTLKEQITLLTPDERRKVEELKEQIRLNKDKLIPKHIIIDDIFASINYMNALAKNLATKDDIDHLGNRRLRSVGERRCGWRGGAGDGRGRAALRYRRGAGRTVRPSPGEPRGESGSRWERGTALVAGGGREGGAVGGGQAGGRFPPGPCRGPVDWARRAGPAVPRRRFVAAAAFISPLYFSRCLA